MKAFKEAIIYELSRKEVLKTTHSSHQYKPTGSGYIYRPSSRYQWANSTSEIHKRIDF